MFGKILIILGIVLVVGLLVGINYKTDDCITEPAKEIVERIQKVPLYYNIDNNEVLYVKNNRGEYVEVELDG